MSDSDNPFGRQGQYGGQTLTGWRMSNSPDEREKRALMQLEQSRYALNAQIAAKRKQLGLPEEIFITQENASTAPQVSVELSANPFDDEPPERVLQWLLDYGVDEKKVPTLKKYLSAAVESRYD